MEVVFTCQALYIFFVAFLGNFPQAFSHVGLISSAVNLTWLIGRHL